MKSAVRIICFTLLLSAFPFRATAEDFTNAIHAFLQQRVEVEKRDVGMVVGMVDEHGSRVVSYGKMDNGTDQGVNGDTLFELGSITKTFTGLLLEDMIERGEMKLDDPVAKYLPDSVKMPTHNGKQITLSQLATHTSGLPFLPDNLHPKRMDNPYADYTVEKLYAFLSGYKLTRDPGTKYEYSELGMQLLGEAIALKAGTNYESLLVERICRPLKMDSTRITLTPELKSRLATGHNPLGYPASALEFQSLVGGSALRSTANDLLKYASANLGLTPSGLTPLMEKTHAPRFYDAGWSNVGLIWMTTHDLPGMELVCHGGGTFGHSTFIGLDKTRRRGVVVLSSSWPETGISRVGWFLLESEWPSDRRPQETKVGSRFYDSYVGQYQLSPNFSLGVFMLQALLLDARKAVVWVPAGFCLAVLLFLLWRASRSRKLQIILGCLALVGVISAVVAPVVASRKVCAHWRPVIGIRHEGDRIYAQMLQLTVELLPKSETRYFERMSGIPMEFSRDRRGKVTCLTLRVAGKAFSFTKTSEQAPEAPKPRITIKLDPKLYDGYLGRYEFASDDLFPDGLNMTIRRQGEQLTAEASNKNGDLGAVDIYPASETNFVLTIGVELIFNKNGKGEMTNVIRHVAGWPDIEGKKLSDPVKLEHAAEVQKRRE